MASEHTTWKPTTEHGDLSTHDREKLPDSAYAFPKQRKEPLTDKSHVQNALSRFDQVEGVSDDDRDLAFQYQEGGEALRAGCRGKGLARPRQAPAHLEPQPLIAHSHSLPGCLPHGEGIFLLHPLAVLSNTN